MLGSHRATAQVRIEEQHATARPDRTLYPQRLVDLHFNMATLVAMSALGDFVPVEMPVRFTGYLHAPL